MNAAMTSESLTPPRPDDLASCHAVIAELVATIRLQAREKAQLMHRVQQLLEQLYGRRSEKLDVAQLLLFAEQAAALAPATDEDAPVEGGAPEAPVRKKGHGRQKPSAALPRLPIEHPVPEADRFCPACQRDKVRIGEEVTEQLEYAPASLFVIEHIQPKYACPCCQDGVTMAKKPAQPLEKGLPGPGLLAHVVVSKYGDHLPLYRQESILARQGLDVSRQTLWGWVNAAATLAEPVVEAMRVEVLQSKVIHTDDTPVTVQAPGGGTYTGRFWDYVGDGAHPYTIYDYTPSRKRDGPVTYLQDFVGTPEQPRYLQADAFGGYDGIYTGGTGVFEVACWAHARRKLYNARHTDVARAHEALGFIRQLYLVEREVKDLDAAARQAQRQEKSKPVLQAFEAWLSAQASRVLPKSPMGEAVQYSRNHWIALNRYLDDGDLDIDNNEAERALRGIAIGRKNWLGLGSDRGGRAAATLYSLVQSAKRHALDPFVYLRDVFLRIPSHPNKAIHQLFPDHWKREILPSLTPPPRL